MTWQLALFFHILFATVRSGIQKKVVGTVQPVVFLLYAMCYFSVGIFSLYLIFFKRLPTIFPEMILLGMVFAVSTACLFSAIKISLSKSSVFGSYAMVVSMFLAALFLGESQFFNPFTLVGQKTIIGLILAGVSLALLAQSKPGLKNHTNGRWLGIMLLYYLFDGIGQFGNKAFLATHEPLETLISQMIGMVPFLFFFIRFRKHSLKVTTAENKWIAVDSLAEIGFAFFLLTALKLGPVALVLPIQKITIMTGSTLVGLILFKELQEYSKEKIFGMLLGIGGILLLIL